MNSRGKLPSTRLLRTALCGRPAVRAALKVFAQGRMQDGGRCCVSLLLDLSLLRVRSLDQCSQATDFAVEELVEGPDRGAFDGILFGLSAAFGRLRLSRSGASRTPLLRRPVPLTVK
jgi:hypothetical protein